MSVILTAESISKVYRGGHSALSDVTFSILPGRIVLLLGANGAGKSSLVHIACQVTRPTAGRLTLGITQGREIGWCSQAQMIDWWTSVYNNVYLGPVLCGRSQQQAKAETLAALELLGLADLAHSRCDHLSGGQLQRVQVARALAHQPKLLFLDEPTVGLDAQTSRNLLGHIRKLADDGATVILASHELDVVQAYCDEVLLLDRGKLIEHTFRDDFVRGWSREEVVEVSYDGELSESQLEALTKLVLEVQEIRPLRARITRNTSHVLLQAILAMVPVTGFKLETPGLLDAFVSYQTASSSQQQAEVSA